MKNMRGVMRFAHALVALLAVSAPVAFAAPRCKIAIDMPKPKDGGGFACGEKIDVRIRVLCDGKAVATNAWVALDNWGPGVVIPRCDAWLYGSRHVPPFDRETTHVIASTPDP